jgi:hypothetical protein
MTISEVLRLAGAIIGALGGGALIVFALSSWLGKIWANRLMEADKATHARALKQLESDLSRVATDRSRKLENLMHHYERQIEEFYGPLFNMVHQVFVSNHIQSEILAKTSQSDSEKTRDYFHTTYLDPLHDEIRRILRTKLYLIEGSEMPRSFYDYLRHSAQERDQRALWKQYGINSSFLQGQPWPDRFYHDIKGGFETAMKNYDKCLDGLKA